MAECRKIPVVIDCDPGVDDILALILARRSLRLDVRAITAVAGNVERDRTLANALKVVSFLDWNVPVARGADRPICCPLHTAKEVHGADGMLGVTLPDTDRQPVAEPAWDVIWNEAVRAEGELTLIAVGPLTNVALALARHPDLPRYLKRIVVMGGAFSGGNTTPATEFNIYVDPEAAEMVLHSGVPVVLCPLDVTHKAYITAEEGAAVSRAGVPETELFAKLAVRGIGHGGRYTGGKGAALHDPCAVLFAEDDSYFTYERCSVVVETAGLITRGMTVTDLWSDKQLELNNAYVVYDIDRERFIAHIGELMAQY